MPDGEGGPAPDGALVRTGERSVAEPSEVPGEPGSVPASMVLGYVDLAITGTLEYERYRGVYLGPWWVVDEVPAGVHVWKRALLRRVPTMGAEHWGHLFLIVRYDHRETLGWFSRDWRGKRVPAPSSEHLVLRKGDLTAELAVRTSDPVHREKLDGFAREVTERFRRQMD